jgi:hypothetical protein
MVDARHLSGVGISFVDVPLVRPAVVALLLILAVSCVSNDTDVVFYVVDGYRFSSADRRAIERIASTTAIEVRRLLPTLPTRLTLRVRTGKKVIPELGTSAESNLPEVVYWTVDPSHKSGVRGIVKTYLRQTLFHEFHHLVRGSAVGHGRTLLDEAISEGLATVFERDFAAGAVPWGAYPAEVARWVPEIMALPPDAPRRMWMSQHPDGRRWIGYKVGTYLVDRAIDASGRSAADLTTASTDEIVRLASVR